MPKNDNTKCPPGQCEHEPSLIEAGRLVCRWCADVRDAAPAVVVGVDVPVGAVVVIEERRAA